MENKILATVGGFAITDADVTEFLRGMGKNGQAYDNPEGRKAVLSELVSQKLLLLDAQKNLLEAEPAFKAQLKKAKEGLRDTTQATMATRMKTVKPGEI